VLSSVTDEFRAELENLDLAEIRRRGGIVRVMLAIARRHPDAFRLLWRQAAHEPAFAALSHYFRKVLAEYVANLILLDGGIIEPPMMRWCATALAANPLDGMSACSTTVTQPSTTSTPCCTSAAASPSSRHGETPTPNLDHTRSHTGGRRPLTTGITYPQKLPQASVLLPVCRSADRSGLNPA